MSNNQSWAYLHHLFEIIQSCQYTYVMFMNIEQGFVFYMYDDMREQPIEQWVTDNNQWTIFEDTKFYRKLS